MEAGSVEVLKRELVRSRPVDPADVRLNIVTMNSRICSKNIGNGRKEVYSLVFPDSSEEKESLCVFSKIGAQVIGNPIGTVVKDSHAGENYLMIEEILYQLSSGRLLPVTGTRQGAGISGIAARPASRVPCQGLFENIHPPWLPRA